MSLKVVPCSESGFAGENGEVRVVSNGEGSWMFELGYCTPEAAESKGVDHPGFCEDPLSMGPPPNLAPVSKGN